MHLSFANKWLERQCEMSVIARGVWGNDAAVVQRRLKQLEAAPNLAMFQRMPARLRIVALDGCDPPQFQLAVVGPLMIYLMATTPDGDPVVEALLEPSAITAVRILRIEASRAH